MTKVEHILKRYIVLLFSKKGFNVKSYGSGNQVKLPGAAPNQPNVYSFLTTYDEMYKDLIRKDRQLYPYLLAVSTSFCEYLWYIFVPESKWLGAS